MRFLPFWSLVVFSLVSCASFTSSSKDETKITQESFTKYMGDRQTLDRIISISGTIAKRFPLDARFLDDILSEDHLYQMCLALEKSDLTGFGKLVRELSPERFDSLCTRLDRNGGKKSVWRLCKGYENFASKWKRASEIQKGTPVTPENAMIYRFESKELCDLMQSRPTDILTIKCKRYCGRLWLEQGKHDLIRQWILESRDGPYLGNEVLNAFAQHQDQLIAWYKFAINGGFFLNLIWIYLPGFLDVEHLKLLRDFIASKECTASLHFETSNYHSDEQKKVINDISNRAIFKDRLVAYDFDNVGFDHQPFMGKWPIAKNLNPHLRVMHRSCFRLGDGFPQDLNEALDSALKFGDVEALENTILIMSSFESIPNSTITDKFWDWYDSVVDSYKPEPYFDRWSAIFSLVKQHLTWITIPTNYINLERPLPNEVLWKDMLKRPSAYFPAHLESQGIYCIQTTVNFLSNEVFPENIGYSHIEAPAPQLFSNILKKNLQRSIGSFVEVLGWIALSSNYRELNGYLNHYTPQFILMVCKDLALRRRISLMLHLSHKTTSLLPTGQIVEKNGIFFRDWVMSRLFSKHLADIKLLDYYFTNRFNGHYPNFDVVVDNHVLGLLGTCQPPHDPMRAMDLFFPADVNLATEILEDAKKKDNVHQGRGVKRTRDDRDDGASGEDREPASKKSKTLEMEPANSEDVQQEQEPDLLPPLSSIDLEIQTMELQGDWIEELDQ